MTSTSIKHVGKLLAYAGCSTIMVCSISHYEQNIIVPFITPTFGGRWKFLTHWTLYVMAIYWTLAFIAGLVHRSYDHRDGFIHRLVDYIHASIAFPMGMAVCVLFWGIYAVNRELVFPKRIDEFIPVWLNHVMHSVHVPFLLMDKHLVSHAYPKQSHGLPLLLVLPVLYQLWILYLGMVQDLWVYPVLHVMNWPLRIVFFFISWLLFFFLYKIGSVITDQVWGDRLMAQARKVT